MDMTITRRQAMAGMAGAVLAAAGASAPGAENARPNILWMLAEDFGIDLSCYGSKDVQTPNIDQLAAGGVRYTHFYCTAPVCSPSRSSFMTGMYQTTIGVHNHRSHRDDGYKLPEGVRLLTDWMRDLGYFTANIRQFPAGVGFRGTGKTDWNFTYTGKPFDSANWADLKSHQPFFAQVSFSETHRAFHGPKKTDPDKITIPPYYPDHPVTRADYARYYDDTIELNRKVGVVLQQLEADGLADNTIVVFMGDNGIAMVRGKQFVYEEGLHVPLIIRWPKGLTPPKQITPGGVDGRMLMAIDIAPTMIALGGGKKPAKMQGEPLFGEGALVDREYVFGARDRCDETAFRLRTVRDRRYRYIRNFTPDRPFLQSNSYKEKQYPVWNLMKELHTQGKLTPEQDFYCRPTTPAEELYDLQTDPHQVKNLAAMPEHQQTLARLRGVLEKWIEQTNDQGRVMEPEDVVKNEGATRPRKNAQ